MEHVLIVEDDHYSREVANLMFKYHHIATDFAASAEEALDLLKSNSYQCVVIDLALPGMDGWSLLRSIKSELRLSALPCVAVTAFHDSTLHTEALDAGFDAYFPKPLHTSFVAQLQQTVLR